jgi:hypothetical protein
MYKLLAGILLFLGASAALSYRAPEPPKDCCTAPAADIQKQVVAPYVQINSPGGTGSGTLVQIDGKELVLTAGHVAREAVAAKKDGKDVSVQLLKLTGGKQTSLPADVAYFSDTEENGGHDLALLAPIGPTGWTPARVLAESAGGTGLEVGEDVYYIGTPAGLHASLEKSIVSRTDYLFPGGGRDRDVIVNGNVWFGNSGGGVFVKRPEGFLLAAVVVRSAADPRQYPKCPGACKSPEVIRAFLDDYRKGAGR